MQLISVSYQKQIRLFSYHVTLLVHNMFLYCSRIKLLCSVHFMACLVAYCCVGVFMYIFTFTSEFGIQNSGTWTLTTIIAEILQLV